MRGKFITLEGGEGAGKTTQIKLIENFLQQKGIKVRLTREPGGVRISEVIRNLLFDPDLGDNICIETEILLFYAARAQWLKELLKPTLDEGTWVVSDRCFDTGYVYQGYIKGGSMKWLEELTKRVMGTYMPDLTFFVDIPVETVIKRLSIRTGEENRHDTAGYHFHRKAREGYLFLMDKYPNRIVQINGNQNKEKVFDEIVSAIEKKLM